MEDGTAASSSSKGASAGKSALVKRYAKGGDGSESASSAGASSITATQVFTATAAALVVTSALILPFIDNADVEVHLDVEFVGGILSYSIEILNPNEEDRYYAFAYEGNTLIEEGIEIVNGRLDHTVNKRLVPYQDHRVEVRTGVPSWYVLESSTIPALPTWAILDRLEVGTDNIEYELRYKGEGASVVLEDPAAGTVVYSRSIAEGTTSDMIGNLKSSHVYLFTVGTQTETYLTERIETEYSAANWDHITVIDNAIDYGVDVNASNVPMRITLYDPATSSSVYSSRLSLGLNTGTITQLEFGHTYELRVASDDETYLTESVTTDAGPITVTIERLVPMDNTIEYELNVSGEDKTVTLELFDTVGGPPLYTATLVSGYNIGIIDGLDYGHDYLLTVHSIAGTYLNETVRTEEEPTDVTVNDLYSTESEIGYNVTVTGGRDTATVYLVDPSSGRTVYTRDLSLGTNRGTIGNLASDHGYRFTISSGTEVYYAETVRTKAVTTVIVNSITGIGNTIEYDVTVTGDDPVTAYLYEFGGPMLYERNLSRGSNVHTIDAGLIYNQEYRFTVSSGTVDYVVQTVSTEPNVVGRDVSAVGNVLSYTIEVYERNGWGMEVWIVDPNGSVVGQTSVMYNLASDDEIITDTFGDEPNGPRLDWETTYTVFAQIGDDNYMVGEATTTRRFDAQFTAVANTIEYIIDVHDKGASYAEIKLTDSVIQIDSMYVDIPLDWSTVTDVLRVTGVIRTDPQNNVVIEWNTTYDVAVIIGNREYPQEPVTTQDLFDIHVLEVDGLTVRYEIRMNDYSLETKTIQLVYSAYGAQEWQDLFTGINSDTLQASNPRYDVLVRIAEDEYRILTSDSRVSVERLRATGLELEYDLTVSQSPNPKLAIYRNDLGGREIDEIDLVDGRNTGTYTLDWGTRYVIKVRFAADPEHTIGYVQTPPAVAISNVAAVSDSVSCDIVVNLPPQQQVILALCQDDGSGLTAVAELPVTGSSMAFNGVAPGVYKVVAKVGSIIYAESDEVIVRRQRGTGRI